MAQSRFAQERTTNGDRRSVPVEGEQNIDQEQEANSARFGELKSCYVSDEGEHKAVWHAKNIFTLAQGAQRTEEFRNGERIHLLVQTSTSPTGESAHYSHAIYYASMILWSSEALRKSARQSKHDRSDTSFAVTHALQEGIDLLSRSTSRVAEIYKNTLQSLGAAVR